MVLELSHFFHTRKKRLPLGLLTRLAEELIVKELLSGETEEKTVKVVYRPDLSKIRQLLFITPAEQKYAEAARELLKKLVTVEKPRREQLRKLEKTVLLERDVREAVELLRKHDTELATVLEKIAEQVLKSYIAYLFNNKKINKDVLLQLMTILFNIQTRVMSSVMPDKDKLKVMKILDKLVSIIEEILGQQRRKEQR